ncbi:unnamed protein product [Heligmosomoides polygyrus]|uniref:ER membrane protein complex subunit 4 n=1 Tax=Heligmosomoides polygyrus TaxID=6339 RepID=A0A183FXJ7_HELPZ|nr:unnamed protein product [Heligmosomoides polygyrus]
MTYGVGVAQNNTDLGGGGGMNDEEYDENSSARLFERSRIKALAVMKHRPSTLSNMLQNWSMIVAVAILGSSGLARVVSSLTAEVSFLSLCIYITPPELLTTSPMPSIQRAHAKN